MTNYVLEQCATDDAVLEVEVVMVAKTMLPHYVSEQGQIPCWYSDHPSRNVTFRRLPLKRVYLLIKSILLHYIGCLRWQCDPP